MINVGYLVSYDYSFLLTSIKPLYDHVDSIHLAIDENRLTWSGNKFTIEETFFDEIKKFDVKKKFFLYFDNFYIKELKPMDCETRQRNMLLKKMGKGWKIQLDVDEYIFDFPAVVKFLDNYWYFKMFPKLFPIQFRGRLVTLFRELNDGFLYIENNERFTFITNHDQYTTTRTISGIKSHYTNLTTIHQSWARSENEILMKINNWGHRDDFDTKKYFDFWKSLTSSNYQEFKNIHPIRGEVWNELQFMPSKNIDDFIQQYSSANSQEPIFIDKIYMIKTIFKKIYNKIRFK